MALRRGLPRTQAANSNGFGRYGEINLQKFFASFFQERRLFFFEKKKQKTFECLGAPGWQTCALQFASWLGGRTGTGRGWRPEATRSAMLYDVLKMLHVVGVIVLIGNVTVTSFWKVFADRTGDPRIIAHAQYLVTVTDWFFTLSGIVLIVGGGFGAAYVAGMPPFAAGWLAQAEALFLLSGLVWLFVLVPAQIRQARLARAFAHGGPIPDAYWRDSRRWLVWGIVATVPLVAALYVMIAKV